jgi:ubiquinone/menaquinone biosynthesis C-methylase UbiE
MVAYWLVLTLFGKKPKTTYFQRMYDLMSSKLIAVDQNNIRFLNYGYRDELRPAVIDSLTKYERAQISQVSLYHALAAPGRGFDLAGKTILEIGCGRGGGTVFLARQLGVQRAVGIDLSAVAVANNQAFFEDSKNVQFEQGDAQQLRFADEAFDGIFNLESSHCYPDRDQFIKEAVRVLKKGGHFFYADFFAHHQLEDVEQSLVGSGLRIIEAEVINPQVLAALDHDDESKNQVIKATKVPGFFASGMREFNACKGSMMYRNFLNGFFQYKRYVLQKA